MADDHKTLRPIRIKGAEWKLHRRLVGQSFGLSAMYSNLPIFNKHIRMLLAKISQQIGNGEIDIRLLINRATIGMFMESTLGTNMTADDRKRLSHYLTK